MKRIAIICLLLLIPAAAHAQGIIQVRIVTTLPAKCSPTQAGGLPAVVWKRSGAQIGFHECLTNDTFTYRGFSVSGTTATGMVFMSALNAITSTAAPTNGQLLIGRTGLIPALGTLTGTANETLITTGAGSITIGLAATLNHKVGSSFNFQDPTDATKVFQFNASNITTATTRTVTVPDSNTSLPIFSQFITFSGPTAARTVTLPDSNTTVPIATQQLTFAGPTAARTYTLPDAAVSLNINSPQLITIAGPTAARTFTFPDAAATFAAVNATDTAIPYRSSATAFADTPLFRASPNLIEQRNGATAQTFRVFGTYTDASNNEYVELVTNSGAGYMALQSGKTGSGSVSDLLLYSSGGTVGIGIAGTREWNVGASALSAAVDNVNSIGLAGAARPSTIFLGTGVAIEATSTAGGTTGAQTINKTAGSVNFAAGAAALVVTSDKATTSTYILAVAQTDDATCAVKNVVPASGSFTINMTATCTAETKVAFWILTPD